MSFTPPDTRLDPRLYQQAFSDLGDGRSNATGQVTLTVISTTTVVTDPKVIVGSTISLNPRSASAAAELTSTYVSAVSLGQFTITHLNNAVADRTFSYAIQG